MLKFTKTNVDYSVFISYNKLMFILVYVDNLFIIGEDLNIINSFKNKLSKCFFIINLKSIFYYLNIAVIYRENFIKLD